MIFVTFLSLNKPSTNLKESWMVLYQYFNCLSGLWTSLERSWKSSNNDRRILTHRWQHGRKGRFRLGWKIILSSTLFSPLFSGSVKDTWIFVATFYFFQVPRICRFLSTYQPDPNEFVHPSIPAYLLQAVETFKILKKSGAFSRILKKLKSLSETSRRLKILELKMSEKLVVDQV